MKEAKQKKTVSNSSIHMWGQSNKVPTMSEWADALEPPSTKYVWRVSVEEFDKFKNAAVGEKFVSGKFMMYGATWKLNCYPNGQKEEGRGQISLFLRCCNFGKFAKECEVHYTINIVEMRESQICTHNYTRLQSRGWASFCSNDALQTLDALTIECTIEHKGPSGSPLLLYRQKLAQLPLLQQKVQDAESKLEDAADYMLHSIEPPSMVLDAQIDEVLTWHSSTKDTDLYNKHIAIISEWDRATFALKAFQSIGTEEVGGEDDDDDAKAEVPGGHLIDQYLESHGVIQKQLQRINRVTTNEHLLQLVNHQKLLSVKSISRSSWLISFLYMFFVSILCIYFECIPPSGISQRVRCQMCIGRERSSCRR